MVMQITIHGPQVISTGVVNCFSCKSRKAYGVHVSDYFKEISGRTHFLAEIKFRVLSFIKYRFINRSFSLRLYYFDRLHSQNCGRERVVGIAARYGLDGPGIESRWWRDFPYPSRSAPRPNQHPVQGALPFSWG